MIALVGLDVAGHRGELLGIGAIMLTATGYAIGPMLIKHRLAGLDPRATMGASLAIAAALLTPWAALDLPHRTPSAGAIGSVFVLGLLCTAAGFVVYAILIGEAGHQPRHRDHLRQPGGGGDPRASCCSASALAPARSPDCC